MQLVIGVGSSFLQELVQQTGNTGDIGQLATVMVGVIILAVIAHQLPKMVAGMVTGGGYGGHVGGMGVMTMLGAAVAGSSIARGIATGGAGAAAVAGATGSMTAYEKLMERIGVLEASNAAGGGDIGMVGNGAGRMESAVGSSGVESSPRWSSPAQESAGLAWPGTPSTKPATGKAGASANPTSTLSVTATEPKEPDEPPLERPMSPDEQRGFSAPADWLKNEPGKEEL